MSEIFDEDYFMNICHDNILKEIGEHGPLFTKWSAVRRARHKNVDFLQVFAGEFSKYIPDRKRL